MMCGSNNAWSTYQLRQHELMQVSRVNYRSWGLEAGLDRLLDNVETTSNDDAERAARSRSRLEKHRRVQLVEQSPQAEVASVPNDGAVEARRQLLLIIGSVSADEASLLCAVGEGSHPIEIAAERGVPTGRVRVRLTRLRRRLRAQINLHDVPIKTP